MAGDANYASVALLLHGDGANGSTTFTDNSPSPKTFTAYGNAQISTAQSQFGGASLYFDGTGDYIQASASTDFAFPGDFTIEFWSRKSANGSGGYDCALTTDTTNGSATNGWVVELSSTRGFALLYAGVVVFSYNVGINDSTWNHWAICRSGTTLRAFKAGAQVYSGTYSTSMQANGVFGVGGSSVLTGYRFNGYLDDIRITKGVARYTAAFTPHTVAHPDGPKSVSGVIYDDAGVPCARTVRLYTRSTGALLGAATSDAVTGVYSIHCGDDEVQRIVLDDSGGTLYNDIIDRVIPE